MGIEWHCFDLFLFLVTGLAACDIVMEPVNPIFRPGETARMLCKAPSPIKKCSWLINSRLYEPDPEDTGNVRTFGNADDGECGLEVSFNFFLFLFFFVCFL